VHVAAHEHFRRRPQHQLEHVLQVHLVEERKRRGSAPWQDLEERLMLLVVRIVVPLEREYPPRSHGLSAFGPGGW
jgi:hypothetical protein